MRNSIKHVLLAAYTNSVTWIRSPRVWFVLLIQCIMCYGGLYELGNSLHQFGWKITPVECFLFIASRQRLLTGTLFLVFIVKYRPNADSTIFNGSEQPEAAGYMAARYIAT